MSECKICDELKKKIKELIHDLNCSNGNVLNLQINHDYWKSRCQEEIRKKEVKSE